MADGVLEAENFNLGMKHRKDFFHAVYHIELFENFLLGLKVGGKCRRHNVGKLLSIGNAGGGSHGFFFKLAHERKICAAHFGYLADIGIFGEALLLGLFAIGGVFCDHTFKIRRCGGELLDLGARNALNEYAHIIIRHF